MVTQIASLNKNPALPTFTSSRHDWKSPRAVLQWFSTLKLMGNSANVGCVISRFATRSFQRSGQKRRIQKPTSDKGLDSSAAKRGSRILAAKVYHLHG